MAEDLMNFDLAAAGPSIIKVIGVGGGGSNAVNHMFRQGIKDVDFVVCNTDSQALANSPVPIKIQLGESLTQGLGAGNKPDVGKQAAIENLENIVKVLSRHTKMVFITAGMGGGTGTGAAPIIAKAAKEMGILTVAIVTIPFKFEGLRRINQALEGIAEIEQHVDSLLIINNEKIREIYGDLAVSAAFSKADDVLTVGAKGIAEIITVNGYINVDFADVQTIMTNSGVSIMGSGRSSGEGRAIRAIEAALASPLLNNNDISGAKNILLNITSGNKEVTMDEISQITEYIHSSSTTEIDLIWGNGIDPNLNDEINVTIIATGFESTSIPELYARKPRRVDVVNLNHEDDSISEPVVGTTVTFGKSSIRQTSIDFGQESEDLGFVVKQAKRDSGTNTPQMKPAAKNSGGPIHKSDLSIEQAEQVPAFQRKNVQLEDKIYSKSQEVSRFTLSDDDDMPLKPLNSYLHDNVD
ncbi:cell division protein FtsZ [Williamwhitmania taraxaci]|uniref:Cell division protein FtsZ n=1 Tax=Williamwhitmania taraxaci TaxID=1640674 RepID=A0A1G6L6B9_9BACT|nr:cell division protein FtsZ [Williamwhitmania taraxaci]SDC38727.1 cell division protein FtsZ [Williamwhitmania taraxaci]